MFPVLRSRYTTTNATNTTNITTVTTVRPALRCTRGGFRIRDRDKGVKAVHLHGATEHIHSTSNTSAKEVEKGEEVKYDLIAGGGG